MFERQVAVKFDDDGFSASYPDGSVQSVAWRDLDRVAIETNDTGPWGADVWWVLESRSNRCAYPQGATGDTEALVEFERRLAGFKDEVVIEAMGCTSIARFVCWDRTATT